MNVAIWGIQFTVHCATDLINLRRVPSVRIVFIVSAITKGHEEVGLVKVQAEENNMGTTTNKPTLLIP